VVGTFVDEPVKFVGGLVGGDWDLGLRDLKVLNLDLAKRFVADESGKVEHADEYATGKRYAENAATTANLIHGVQGLPSLAKNAWRLAGGTARLGKRALAAAPALFRGTPGALRSLPSALPRIASAARAGLRELPAAAWAL